MELIDVFKIFTSKRGWENVTDEDKDKYFFIFQRFLSKAYPEKSILLNTKGVDKISSMNLWFEFMKSQPYPKWFWSKSGKVQKTELDDKDFNLLMLKLNINKEDDLVYLLGKFPDVINEELKFFKKTEKAVGKK